MLWSDHDVQLPQFSLESIEQPLLRSVLHTGSTLNADVVVAAALFARVNGMSDDRIKSLTGLTLPEIVNARGSRLPDHWPNLLLRDLGRDAPMISHLDIARSAPTAHMAPIAETVRFADTLLTVLETIQITSSTLLDRIEVSLEHSENEVRFTCSHPADVIDQGRVTEVGLLMTKHMFSDTLDLWDSVKRVELEYGRPELENQYERLFDAPVRTWSGRSSLVFYADALDRKPRDANPLAFEYLFSALVSQQVDGPAVITDEDLARLCRAILDNAFRSEFSAAAAAERANMSLRTAQRLMEKRGTSLSKVIDELRREFAHRFLADPALSLDDVSDRLGYGDRRAFRRAFSRWTGVPPSQHRDKM